MNPHRDKTIRQEYADLHWMDEISYWLGLDVDDDGIIEGWPGTFIGGTEVNHLWSVGRRPDCWSNLIKLAAPAHSWFHKHLPEGRVMCLLSKARKSAKLGDPRDLNIAELDLAAGKHVIGVVESYRFTDSMMVGLQEELVGRLGKLMYVSTKT